MYNGQKFDKYWTRNESDVSEQMEENAAIRRVKIKAQIMCEWLLLDANINIVQLQPGENKLYSMMLVSTLY